MRTYAEIAAIAAPYEAEVDEEGTIQAWAMVRLDADPTHHTTCSVRQALLWAGLTADEVDTYENAAS